MNATQRETGAPHPFVHAVASAATVLLIGLPFLYVFVRIAVFYRFADSAFGYWVATVVLPIWAVVAVAVGAGNAMFNSRAQGGLGRTLAVTSVCALLLATVLTAVAIQYTESRRVFHAGRDGVPGVSVGHFLAYHLFANTRFDKIDFDPCCLNNEGTLHTESGWRSINYTYFIPDSDLCRKTVLSLDATARFEDTVERAGVESGRVRVYGNTRQRNPANVLRGIATLPYVRRIQMAAIAP